jgi:hypothetical protein
MLDRIKAFGWAVVYALVLAVVWWIPDEDGD